MADELEDEGGLVETATQRRFGLTAVSPRERSLGPRLLPRLGAGAATGLLALLVLTQLGPEPPFSVAGASLGAAVACALLPRLGWIATAVAACLWLASPEAGREGTALVLAAACVPVPLLLPRAGLWWSVPALAPLLGTIGLAPMFVGVAALAPTPRRRAGLGAAGFLWLAFAEIATGRSLLFGIPSGALPRPEWAGSAGQGRRRRDRAAAQLAGAAPRAGLRGLRGAAAAARARPLPGVRPDRRRRVGRRVGRRAGGHRATCWPPRPRWSRHAAGSRARWEPRSWRWPWPAPRRPQTCPRARRPLPRLRTTLRFPMSMLRNLEAKLGGLVEGAFGRAFKSRVQPVELAHKLAKEMEDNQVVSVSRVYVPNHYRVFLSPDDREQFTSYEPALRKELSDYLLEHARSEGLALTSRPQIDLETDERLGLGEFGIQAQLLGGLGEDEEAPEAEGAPSAGDFGHTMVYSPTAAPRVEPGPATAGSRQALLVGAGQAQRAERLARAHGPQPRVRHHGQRPERLAPARRAALRGRALDGGRPGLDERHQGERAPRGSA